MIYISVILVFFFRICVTRGIRLTIQNNASYGLAETIYRSISFSEIRSFSTSNIRMEKLKIAVIGKKYLIVQCLMYLNNGYQVY